MISAIITAAGSGTRMKASFNKIFLEVEQKPILYWTLIRILQTPSLQEIILTHNPNDETQLKEFLASYSEFSSSPIPIKTIIGGKRRQDSMANGAKISQKNSELLLLHDAVRPFCRLEKLQQVCNAAKETGAALLVEPVTSTVKKKKDAFVETVDRTNLYLAQTPQVIQRELYLNAVEKMYQENWEVTDDISLVEKLALPVQLVEGDPYNIKITFPSDLPFASFIHQHYFQKLNH